MRHTLAANSLLVKETRPAPEDIQAAFSIIKKDLAALENELLASIHSPVKLVMDAGQHLVKAGGKRIRPALFLVCARAGRRPKEAVLLPLAMAIEMIHMATLVHDDVIDVSAIRRGRPTVNAKWGNYVAVLTGDYLFAKAFDIIAPFVSKKMLAVLSRVITIMCEGEIKQTTVQYDPEVTEDDYLGRIAAKTAEFMAACAELGAMAGGFSPAGVAALRRYGFGLGMAFQITDDLLDFTASSEQLGKPAGNDLRQGIVTLPVIHALRSSPERRLLYEIILSRDMDETRVQRAIDIVQASGSLAYAADLARRYLEEAKSSLPAALGGEIRTALTAVADFVGQRRN